MSIFTNPDIIRARAEARRAGQDAELDRRERLAKLKRQEQRAARTDRRTKLNQRHARWVKRCQSIIGGVRRHGPSVAVGVLVAVPVIAPMTVAWTGQAETAVSFLHWPTWGGIVFAAAWESVGILSATLHHLTRRAGDRGTVFRAAAWSCASGAALMNYTDRADHWHPTVAAVAYGAMSLMSLAVWELCAAWLHRKSQRAAGRISPPRPRFGAMRWLRFPRLTFWAWSLALRDDLETVRGALDAATLHLANLSARPHRPWWLRGARESNVSAGQDTQTSAPELRTGGAPETPTNRPVQAVGRRSRKAKGRPRKALSKRGGRRTLEDFVSVAREHLTSGVEVTPLWVRQVTGCGRSSSTRVAELLNTERNEVAA